MPKVTDGRGSFLEKATILGINFLQKNDNPFFIMSEGAQVDWAGHDYDSDYLVSEMIDFDKKEALKDSILKKKGFQVNDNKE